MAASLDAFKAALASDPRLKVDARTTRAYYSEQSARLSSSSVFSASPIGAIMAVGAVFGAFNSMYAAVASRTREIATLRAIGFRGVPVIVSVLLETMLLAMLGGISAPRWHGCCSTTTRRRRWAQTSARSCSPSSVSPALLWTGLKWALVIGFVGGLFPALRAARMPVTSGLREL